MQVNPLSFIYEDLLSKVLREGVSKEDRTNTGTLSIFGAQLRYDLNQGFPLITTKRVHFKSIVAELLWMLKGQTNISPLNEQGVTIWDEWADPNGDLGPIYGKQWRKWDNRDGTHIDQIHQALSSLIHSPDSRRILVSAWNPTDLPDMALPPCHAFFQFYTTPLTSAQRLTFYLGQEPQPSNLSNYSTLAQEYAKLPDAPSSNFFELVNFITHKTQEGSPEVAQILDTFKIPSRALSLQIYQRSADLFLGVPFNLASYALLTHMFAQQANLFVKDLIWTGGDCHIYQNHTEQVKTQLSRLPRPFPTLKLTKAESLTEYTSSHITLLGYDPHSKIPAPVAV